MDVLWKLFAMYLCVYFNCNECISFISYIPTIIPFHIHTHIESICLLFFSACFFVVVRSCFVIHFVRISGVWFLFSAGFRFRFLSYAFPSPQPIYTHTHAHSQWLWDISISVWWHDHTERWFYLPGLEIFIVNAIIQYNVLFGHVNIIAPWQQQKRPTTQFKSYQRIPP